MPRYRTHASRPEALLCFCNPLQTVLPGTSVSKAASGLGFRDLGKKGFRGLGLGFEESQPDLLASKRRLSGRSRGPW